MLRLLCGLVVAVVVSGFALLLITGQYINEGPILFLLTPAHGVHLGDLFVITGWAAAMLALAVRPREVGSQRGGTATTRLSP